MLDIRYKDLGGYFILVTQSCDLLSCDFCILSLSVKIRAFLRPIVNSSSSGAQEYKELTGGNRIERNLW